MPVKISIFDLMIGNRTLVLSMVGEISMGVLSHGIYYKISIAFAIRSVDRSLSSRFDPSRNREGSFLN